MIDITNGIFNLSKNRNASGVLKLEGTWDKEDGAGLAAENAAGAKTIENTILTPNEKKGYGKKISHEKTNV